MGRFAHPPKTVRGGYSVPRSEGNVRINIERRIIVLLFHRFSGRCFFFRAIGQCAWNGAIHVACDVRPVVFEIRILGWEWFGNHDGIRGRGLSFRFHGLAMLKQRMIGQSFGLEK